MIKKICYEGNIEKLKDHREIIQTLIDLVSSDLDYYVTIIYPMGFENNDYCYISWMTKPDREGKLHLNSKVIKC